MHRRQQRYFACGKDSHQVGIPYAVSSSNNIGEPMTKALDHIDDVIRNSKHPFRQVADRPEKPQKHRYERRKIREYIRAADWMPGR
jgi:hypothetical protein